MNDDQWVKAPGARLDFQFDWSPWLAASETITAHAITSTPAGLTVADETEAEGKVTGWYSDGELGVEYEAKCRITTSAGRTDERSMRIYVDKR